MVGLGTGLCRLVCAGGCQLDGLVEEASWLKVVRYDARSIIILGFALAVPGVLHSAPPMKKSLLIAGIVVGSLLALGPLWGMLGTILGMNHAFDTLAGNGIRDPRALSAAIGQTLMATALGLVACPVGVRLLAIFI